MSESLFYKRESGFLCVNEKEKACIYDFCKSIQYAYENNMKIITAGTDFHAVEHVGCSALRSRFIPKDSFELAELLKSGDYVLEIGENAIVLP